MLSISCLLSFSPLVAESLDQRLYDAIRDGWQSPLMDDVMNGVTKMGDRETCLMVCLGLSALGNDKARQVGKVSTVSLLAGQTVCTILKLAVNRDRPEGDSDRDNSSFPSGHVAGAFSVSYVIGNKYPKLKLPCHLVAALIAVSRVYLGRHWPSDVLAGAIIGCSAGYLAIRYEQAILTFHL